MNYFYIFLSSFFISLLAVPPLRQWAINSGRLDEPERRKIHKEALPRIGGVAIFISFLFAALVFLEISVEVRGLLAGCMIMFLIGLVDDLSGLTPRQKLLGQTVAAALSIALSGVYLHNLGDLLGQGDIALPGWVGIPFTVFALVGVANAVNMMDGLDGLAGGISVIALGGFVILAWQTDNDLVIGLSLAVLGSLLGFLKDNSYPASIFMGDSGSLVLGFILGTLAVFLTSVEGPTVSPVVPVVVLGLPIIDTLTVMMRRVRKGLSPFYPDLTHVHHKFLNLGFHHRFTVIVIYSVTLAWTLLAISGAGRVSDTLFFWGYLAFVVFMYWFLRSMLKHPDRFSYLQEDSSASLRKSAVYGRLVSSGKYLGVPLIVLVCGYFILTSVSCGKATQVAVLNIVFVVLGSGFLLLLASRSTRPRVMMVFYISATMLTVFLSEQNCSVVLFGALRMEILANIIFIIVGGLVVYKVVFREKGELYLTTPLDFLLLSIVLAFAVISPEFGEDLRLADVCIKAIVLILAIKILSSGNRVFERLIYWGLQFVLLTFVAKNII